MPATPSAGSGQPRLMIPARIRVEPMKKTYEKLMAACRAEMAMKGEGGKKHKYDIPPSIEAHFGPRAGKWREVYEALRRDGYSKDRAASIAVSTVQKMTKAITGEGARGGHIIGHTRSGKPIYARKHTPESFASHHEGWSVEDHEDAQDHHNSAAVKATRKSEQLAHDAYVQRYIPDNLRTKGQKHLPSAKRPESEMIKLQNEMNEKASHHVRKAHYHNRMAQAHEAMGKKREVAGEYAALAHRAFKKGEPVRLMVKATKGEGARGGKVIGHTKTGKPIYDSHNHPAHAGFSWKDHTDAIRHHAEKQQHAEKEIERYGSMEERTKRAGQERKAARYSRAIRSEKQRASGHAAGVAGHRKARDAKLQARKAEREAGAYNKQEQALIHSRTKKVGETGSGKPIHAVDRHNWHTAHHNWTPDDHHDAARYHEQAATHFDDRGADSLAHFHEHRAEAHLAAATGKRTEADRHLERADKPPFMGLAKAEREPADYFRSVAGHNVPFVGTPGHGRQVGGFDYKSRIEDKRQQKIFGPKVGVRSLAPLPKPSPGTKAHEEMTAKRKEAYRKKRAKTKGTPEYHAAKRDKARTEASKYPRDSWGRRQAERTAEKHHEKHLEAKRRKTESEKAELTGIKSKRAEAKAEKAIEAERKRTATAKQRRAADKAERERKAAETAHMKATIKEADSLVKESQGLHRHMDERGKRELGELRGMLERHPHSEHHEPQERGPNVPQNYHAWTERARGHVAQAKQREELHAKAEKQAREEQKKKAAEHAKKYPPREKPWEPPKKGGTFQWHHSEKGPTDDKAVDVHGNFVVHKTEAGHTVTHGPSGLSVGRGDNKQMASIIAKHLHEQAPGWGSHFPMGATTGMTDKEAQAMQGHVADANAKAKKWNDDRLNTAYKKRIGDTLKETEGKLADAQKYAGHFDPHGWTAKGVSRAMDELKKNPASKHFDPGTKYHERHTTTQLRKMTGDAHRMVMEGINRESHARTERQQRGIGHNVTRKAYQKFHSMHIPKTNTRGIWSEKLAIENQLDRLASKPDDKKVLGWLQQRPAKLRALHHEQGEDKVALQLADRLETLVAMKKAREPADYFRNVSGHDVPFAGTPGKGRQVGGFPYSEHFGRGKKKKKVPTEGPKAVVRKPTSREQLAAQLDADGHKKIASHVRAGSSLYPLATKMHSVGRAQGDKGMMAHAQRLRDAHFREKETKGNGAEAHERKVAEARTKEAKEKPPEKTEAPEGPFAARRAAQKTANEHKEKSKAAHAEAEKYPGTHGNALKQVGYAHSAAADAWNRVHHPTTGEELKGARKKAEKATASTQDAEAKAAEQKAGFERLKAKFKARGEAEKKPLEKKAPPTAEKKAPVKSLHAGSELTVNRKTASTVKVGDNIRISTAKADYGNLEPRDIGMSGTDMMSARIKKTETLDDGRIQVTIGDGRRVTLPSNHSLHVHTLERKKEKPGAMSKEEARGKYQSAKKSLDAVLYKHRGAIGRWDKAEAAIPELEKALEAFKGIPGPKTRPQEDAEDELRNLRQKAAQKPAHAKEQPKKQTPEQKARQKKAEAGAQEEYATESAERAGRPRAKKKGDTFHLSTGTGHEEHKAHDVHGDWVVHKVEKPENVEAKHHLPYRVTHQATGLGVGQYKTAKDASGLAKHMHTETGSGGQHEFGKPPKPEVMSKFQAAHRGYHQKLSKSLRTRLAGVFRVPTYDVPMAKAIQITGLAPGMNPGDTILTPPEIVPGSLLTDEATGTVIKGRFRIGPYLMEYQKAARKPFAVLTVTGEAMPMPFHLVCKDWSDAMNKGSEAAHAFMEGKAAPREGVFRKPDQEPVKWPGIHA